MEPAASRSHGAGPNDAAWPRLLLLSGVPPGAANVGEIVLADLGRAYPSGRLACYAVVPPHYRTVPVPELSGIPVRVGHRRGERARRPLPGRAGALVAHAGYLLGLRPHARRLAREAAAFGREQGAEVVWAVLNAATTVAMAEAVADELGAPLVTLVWDPPEHLMRELGYGRISARALRAEFGRAVRRSERVAVVSDAMAELYGSTYGTPAVVLRHGVPAPLRRPAAEAPRRDGRFVLGFAGGLYARSAWQTLLDALAAAGWRVGGREVVLRVLGADVRLRSRGPARVEYLGFRPPAETLDILAGCDAAYLPVPFEPGLRDIAELSFPSKLSTYVGTGRPVLVHAPPYAAVSRFCAERPVGAHCDSLRPEALLAALEPLAGDADAYREAARAAAAVAAGELSAECFHARFSELVRGPAASGAAGG